MSTPTKTKSVIAYPAGTPIRGYMTGAGKDKDKAIYYKTQKCIALYMGDQLVDIWRDTPTLRRKAHTCLDAMAEGYPARHWTPIGAPIC